MVIKRAITRIFGKQAPGSQTWQPPVSNVLDQASHQLSLRGGNVTLAASSSSTMAEMDRLRTRCAELETAAAAIIAARDDAERKLGERFSEVAMLTNLLRQKGQETLRKTEQFEWLRAVYAQLAATPAWWALMPRQWRQRRLHRRLARRHLFDAQSYLSTHSDVGSFGMDPLRHYILHGIEEGRASNHIGRWKAQ